MTDSPSQINAGQTLGPSADALPPAAPALAQAAADTTPSFVSSANQPADTPVAGGQPSLVPREAERDFQKPLPFARLGHYEIVRKIGQGGVGDVYQGYEQALDRKVALKVLRADLARSDDFVRRFKAEVTAAARLIHPNIIQIHFIGELEGHHYFAMQYVEGESLADLLQRRGKLTVDETLAIVEQALSGLSAAHEQGMVHRDIKPGNILLDTRSRRALLADFGLAKSLESSVTGKSATGIIMGTMDYISPEQGRGQTVDGRSDLYSIGVLLFRPLSGQFPFTADNPAALLFQHVYERPPELKEMAPEVPQMLAQIVARLLAKSPADRHQTADDVLADLRAIRSGESLPSPRGGDRPGSNTAIIRLPTFDDPAPLLPTGLTNLARAKWWEPARDRALSLFRRHAPEALQQLQNTQQQVDGAVAVYERRQRDLQQLADEAEVVVAELRQQAGEQHAAAAAARQRVLAAADSTVARQAQVEEAQCELAATELDRRVAEQEEQLQPIRMQLAQARAKVQQLGLQRDILNARLKAAGAWAHVQAGSRPGRRRWNPGLLIAAGLCLAAIVFLSIQLPVHNSRTTAERVLPVTPVPVPSIAPQESLEIQATKEDLSKRFDGPLSVFPVKSRVNAMAFAPHSTTAAEFNFATADSDGFVSLYQTGRDDQIELVVRLPALTSSVRSLAYAPDGKRLAVGSEEGLISVWDVVERQLLHRLTAHAGMVPVVTFTADGGRLLSAGRDDLARLWDVAAEIELKRFRLPRLRGWPDFVAWSLVETPDGSGFFFGSRSSGPSDSSLYRLDAAKYRLEAAKEEFAFQGVNVPVHHAAFTPDGSRLIALAGLNQGEFVVWDAKTGERLAKFGDRIRAGALTPDGSRGFVESKNGKIEFWDTSTGVVLQSWTGTKGLVDTVALSTDGSRGLTVGRNIPMTLWCLSSQSTRGQSSDSLKRAAQAAPLATERKPADRSLSPQAAAIAPGNSDDVQAVQRAVAAKLGRQVVERNSIGMDLVLVPPGDS